MLNAIADWKKRRRIMQTQNELVKRDNPEAVRQRPAVAPVVDVFENKDEVLLVADLPGVNTDGLRVDVEEERLVIEGRRGDWDYRRAFVMPDGIERDKIAAELKDGVLRLHLPKAAAVKPRRIEIKGK
jgi:HSP20 family molecular chaperone IbpA